MKDSSFYSEKISNDAKSAMIANRQQLASKYRQAGGMEKYKALRLEEYMKSTERGWTESFIAVETVDGKKKAIRKIKLKKGKQNGFGISMIVGVFESESEAKKHAEEIGLEMF